MNTILFLNDEYCTSIEQLKGYFSEDITPGSDIYRDLLDYGRYGDIAKWLEEKGETELSSKVKSITPNLSDSKFYTQVKSIITGRVGDGISNLRPTFSQCFSFEDLKCDDNETNPTISVILKVLKDANEDYKLSIYTTFGSNDKTINPSNYTVGESKSFDFTLHKPQKEDIGEVTVRADGEKIETSSKFSKDKEIQVGDVKFNMIRVEGGTFLMGAQSKDKNGDNYDAEAFDDESPVHKVTLRDYYIGETPVTQELWQAVMEHNPSHFKGAKNPVETMSWNFCDVFIKKLNQKTGLKFRLPTEAEWEFAARGGIKSKGYKYSGSDNIGEVAWYTGNSRNTTHPVKQKKPNELGIYDMTGNVWEWCQDRYGDYREDLQTNPTGPNSGSGRVNRGGSWYYDARHCRLSNRNYRDPDCRLNDIGLRLVLSE